MSKNRKVTLKWTELNYNDKETFPKHTETVLVTDCLGNVQCCWFDGITMDFMVSEKGIDSRKLRSMVIEKYMEAVEEKLGDKLEKFSDIDLDQICDTYADATAFSTVYFTEALAWMPMPIAYEFLEVSDQPEFEIKTYDVLTALEPAIRRAVADAVSSYKDNENPL